MTTQFLRFGSIALVLCSLAYIKGFAQDNRLSIYGYGAVNVQWESAKRTASGQELKEAEPIELTLPFFNIMAQGQLSDQFRVFINLNGSVKNQLGVIDVRNAWVEYSASQYFNVRVGKMYRRFGLYNEILDATPTYFINEPPDYLLGSFAFLPRTTNLMLHGSAPLASGILSYTVSGETGQSHSGMASFPIGWDVKYKFSGTDILLGTSGFTATNRMADVEFGAGASQNGIKPWLERGNDLMLGGYGEINLGGFTFQAEYFLVNHNDERDPDKVVTMVNAMTGTGSVLEEITPALRSRFLIDPSRPVVASNVRKDASYTSSALFLLAAYTFETSIGDIGIFTKFIDYTNPERISNEQFGGDNEFGNPDQGRHQRVGVGAVYRPIPQITVKAYNDFHLFRFNGEQVSFLHPVLTIAYLFGQ